VQTPLQIVMRHLERSEALGTHIREQAARLETFHPRIVSCRVVVEPPHRHHRQGRPFEVCVEARVPGKELVATRVHDTDVFLAVHEAFDAVRRQLAEDIRQKRGEVRARSAGRAAEENEA